MLITLIRHGKTEGNLAGRYIGRTDQRLCPQGIQELQRLKQKGGYPDCDWLGTSPLLRCRETATLLYPEMPQTLLPDMREMDFGLFEGMNYEELKGEPAYLNWLESGGREAFPGGESRETFCKRCCNAFSSLFPFPKTVESAVLILHGGSIMAIMEAFVCPHRDFYQYQVKNGEGYLLFFDETRWTNRPKCGIVNLIGDGGPL